jgi:molybdopterin converting factor small subunit
VVKVIMLGSLAERAGWSERDDFSPGFLSGLVQMLRDLNPELGAAVSAPSVRTAVNQVVVKGDTYLSSDDEVAFLPIYSGG